MTQVMSGEKRFGGLGRLRVEFAYDDLLGITRRPQVWIRGWSRRWRRSGARVTATPRAFTGWAVGAAAVEDARTRIAGVLGCLPAEVVFTGCGTESDNLALRGVALGGRSRARHLITTPIEHHAVLHTAKALAEQFDSEVTLVSVSRFGVVDPADVAGGDPAGHRTDQHHVRQQRGRLDRADCRDRCAGPGHGIPFHTDAVQAGGFLALDVQALNVDLLALSAHKFYGPKGVGLLYVRRGTRLVSQQTGGDQDAARRSGTENVPYIVGMARALELVQANRVAEGNRLIVSCASGLPRACSPAYRAWR